MSSTNRRVALGVALPVLSLLLAFGPLAAVSQAGASAASDKALALKINMRVSDLTTAEKWTSSPLTPNSAAVIADGQRAVACLRKASAAGAKLGNDPFGLVGKASGSATADVTSPSFDAKGSITGLPSANSEVVFVTSAGQAVNDLAGLSVKSSLSCITTVIQQVSQASGAGKVTVTTSLLGLTRYGAGSGGLHLQFAVKGGQLPSKLYIDEYFYAQSRAEVLFSFANLGSTFQSTWVASAIAHVMARAKTVAG